MERLEESVELTVLPDPAPAPGEAGGPTRAPNTGASGSSSDSDSESSDSTSSEARQEAQQWPPSFCCPITQEPMHDPVIAMDGHSYESQVIAEWLRTHHTSPVTNERLASKVLVRNIALRNAMAEWDALVRSGAEPEPEPEAEAEAEAEPEQEPAPAPPGLPIMFEPQSDWEELTARRRVVGALSPPREQQGSAWWNRACLVLMLTSLALACATMLMFDDPDAMPDHQRPHGGGPSPPPPPPPFSCYRCEENHCCPRCPAPWAPKFEEPKARSLQAQMFKWIRVAPTHVAPDRDQKRRVGDFKFGGVDFRPGVLPQGKWNGTLHFERVDCKQPRRFLTNSGHVGSAPLVAARDRDTVPHEGMYDGEEGIVRRPSHVCHAVAAAAAAASATAATVTETTASGRKERVIHFIHFFLR